jgi:hypothetical protein
MFGHCLREALRHSGDFAVRDVSPALYLTLKVFWAHKKSPDADDMRCISKCPVLLGIYKNRRVYGLATVKGERTAYNARII